jgi:hypothetical protein
VASRDPNRQTIETSPSISETQHDITLLYVIIYVIAIYMSGTQALESGC